MLQSRLYYQDPYMKKFTSLIVRQEIDEHNRPFVVLENTAFYPTGGGQPNDTGTIEGVRVVDVEDVEGEVRHYLETPLKGVQKVSAEVDWERRFDHMQQHAGQHIITAAFVELFGYATVSFHLGREVVTIDLATSHITDEELKAAETLANSIILQNRPIEQKWVEREELHAYSLRKEVQAENEIRLVIIPDFDTNGCGGIHPSSTGQVASLKILAAEKQKKHTRVQFVCGYRVLYQLDTLHRELTKIARFVSSPLTNCATSVEVLLETQRSLERELETAKEELLDHEAASLAKRKSTVIRETFDDYSMQTLQKLARKILALREQAIVILVSESDTKLQFVAARTETLTPDMRTVCTIALPSIEGKGGGSASAVQGGGAKNISAIELAELLERSIPVLA